MNKKEIEQRIFQEVDNAIQEVGSTRIDKGMPILQKRLWEIADKYDTTGGNALNIYFSIKGKELNQ